MSRRGAVAVAGAIALPVAALSLRAATAQPRPGHPYLAGAPLLIAHRGGAALAPENTTLAFGRALEWWDADILELDVQPTRDGDAVVIHDATVDRTTDGRGRVVDLTLAELRELDAGYRFSTDGGRSYPFRGRGERIPTLREVLEAFPTARVNVEIKDGRAQERVWEVIEDLGASSRALIATEKQGNRSRFSAYPGPTSASSAELVRFLLLHNVHGTAFFQPRTDAFQMPERHRGRQVLSPRFIQEAHAKNLPVHVWTVNEEADMRRLLEWGVDGIITDRLDVLARVLHEMEGRPLPPGSPGGEDGA